MKPTKFYFALGLCIAIGLHIGMGVRAALTPDVDRVDSAIEMFTTYCIPFVDRVPVKRHRDLVEAPLKSGRWVDVQSQMTLGRSEQSCAVSDELAYFEDKERAELRDRFEAPVVSSFPSLSTDENHGLTTWDEFSLWAQYPVNDPRRWAVYIGRFVKTGDAAATEITVSRPATSGT